MTTLAHPHAFQYPNARVNLYLHSWIPFIWNLNILPFSIFPSCDLNFFKRGVPRHLTPNLIKLLACLIHYMGQCGAASRLSCFALGHYLTLKAKECTERKQKCSQPWPSATVGQSLVMLPHDSLWNMEMCILNLDIVDLLMSLSIHTGKSIHTASCSSMCESMCPNVSDVGHWICAGANQWVSCTHCHLSHSCWGRQHSPLQEGQHSR